MDIPFKTLSQYIFQIQKMSSVNITKTQAEQLEWFIKRTAIEAVNKNNKEEFAQILQMNDLEKLSHFIATYVPDFSNKFHTYLEKIT